MKAIVIKTFKDKYTGEIHPVGAEVEVTEERAAEIMEAGKYIVIPSGQQEEADPPEAPEQSEEPDPPEASGRPELAPPEASERPEEPAPPEASEQPEEPAPPEAPEQSEISKEPDEKLQKPEVAPVQQRRGRKPKD